MVVGKCDNHMRGVTKVRFFCYPTLNAKLFKRQIILQKYELERFLNVGSDKQY